MSENTGTLRRLFRRIRAPFLTTRVPAHDRIVKGSEFQLPVEPLCPVPDDVCTVREQVPKEFSFQPPSELLCAIFDEYLRLDLPVQNLLKVNRQWRIVALETQSLWRRLLLSADAIPSSLRARSVHACTSEGQATSILNRSGIITKLEITFILGPKEGETPTPEARASLFKTVGHAALHRISFLCIIVNPEMTLALVTASLNDVFCGSLPCLESLKIVSARAIGNLYEPLDALMNIIEESSTKLKSLYLENVNKDFILLASRKTFWTRLVRITIKNEFDSLDASLLSFPSDLESFSFSGELVATPAPFTAHLDSALKTPIELPALKWLRVSLISMGTLARLHMPKLHTMAIDCVQGNYPLPAPPPGTLLLPALKTLQIATINPTIACINAPNLDTLCLSIPALKQADADSVLKAVFYGGEEMMKPKHLTLRGPVHDKYLIAALRSMGEKLVSLELDNQLPFSKIFWMEMTPRSGAAATIAASVTEGVNANTGAGSTSRGAITSTSTAAPPSPHPQARAGGKRRHKPPLLPNLRVLVVDVHKNIMAQGEGEEMRIFLMELIERRRGDELYQPLLRLACKWHEGLEVEEMVSPPMCVSCAHVDLTSGRSLDVIVGEGRPTDLFDRSVDQVDLPTDPFDYPGVTTRTEAPDLSGQVDILDRIFVGTYSTVYIGMCENHKVAVKRLHRFETSQVMKRKFRRECLISWSLRHPNVLTFYGYFCDYDNMGEIDHFLVSKWAEGGCAVQHIYSDYLSWNDRLTLVHGVAKGLTYLHSFIVHGDLKPGNVLLDEHGIAQICDFGLSRLMQDYESTPLNTPKGYTGTGRYLAKELVATKNAVPTRATDVYALGCLAYEFIYRTPPHAALDLSWRISSAIDEGRPPAKRPSGFEDIPALWELLDCCWNADASERPTAVGFFEYFDKNQDWIESALRYIEHVRARASERRVQTR